MATRLIYLSDALVRAPAEHERLIDLMFSAPADRRVAKRLKQAFGARFVRGVPASRTPALLRDVINALSASGDESDRLAGAALQRAAAALSRARAPIQNAS